MDLRENAQTIIEAGQERPLFVQVELLVQLLRAVAYLHHHGIIHRDLKPENVLVENDQVKLVDLGLSLPAWDAEVEAVQLAGTFTHMAPELWRGEAPSPRSDLYAVGMIAFELLAGHYPFTFEADDLLLLQRDIQETELPRPTDQVEPRLVPVLRRLLSQRPEDRYQDAAEVITALAVALDQPLSTETVTTRESFLQAAPFVGREVELEELWQVLRRAIAGEGSAWLVGGGRVWACAALRRPSPWADHMPSCGRGSPPI
jgi:serine/threonine protein kinase